ncbi:hypothetical protein GCM10027070_26250 [Barrientosiimonas humi]
MSGLPAVCGSCGVAFVTDLIDVMPGATVHLTGNQITCPGCGGWARVLDGVFAGSGGALSEVRSGPPTTRAVVSALSRAVHEAGVEAEVARRLAQRLHQLREEGRSEEEQLKAVREASPTLAAKVLTILRDPAWSGVGAVIAMLALVLTLVGQGADADVPRNTPPTPSGPPSPPGTPSGQQEAPLPSRRHSP